MQSSLFSSYVKLEGYNSVRISYIGIKPGFTEGYYDRYKRISGYQPKS